MKDKQPTIYIIDDEEAIRLLVATVVASTGANIKQFASAEQFLEQYERGQPGCLVLDVRLSGMTGLELQQHLASTKDPLPVVLITGHADVPMAVRAMQQGAASFLEKPFANTELLSAVTNALALADKALSAAAERQAIVQRLSELTPNEEAVFELLIEGRPNKGIAAALNLGVRTVESRRASIMKKLDANSLAEIVRMALTADWRPSGKATTEEPSDQSES